jgi:hypothetical protein
MKPKTTTVDNILVFEKEITRISLSEEREDIINKYRSRADTPQVIQTYEDLVSQSIY